MRSASILILNRRHLTSQEGSPIIGAPNEGVQIYEKYLSLGTGDSQACESASGGQSHNQSSGET